MRIDLNADVGEGSAEDSALMRSITSASVAAGGHAGDESTIRDAIRLATARGVGVGAHPGFPDRKGFGRTMPDDLTLKAVEDSLTEQIARVARVAAAERAVLRHVKPHGALYNMAATDPELAAAVAHAVARFDRSLKLFAPPGSEMAKAASGAGLSVVVEAFADRAYEPDGQLVSRQKDAAVIHDPVKVAARAVRLVVERVVEAIDGSLLRIHADSICLHSDTPRAADLASRIRGRLEAAGVVICRP